VPWGGVLPPHHGMHDKIQKSLYLFIGVFAFCILPVSVRAEVALYESYGSGAEVEVSDASNDFFLLGTFEVPELYQLSPTDDTFIRITASGIGGSCSAQFSIASSTTASLDTISALWTSESPTFLDTGETELIERDPANTSEHPLLPGHTYGIYGQSPNCIAGNGINVVTDILARFNGFFSWDGDYTDTFEASAFRTRINNFEPKNVIVNSGISPATTIPWELHYYFNPDDSDLYDSVIVEFANIEPTHPQSMIPDIQTISGTGFLSFTGNKILDDGHIFVITCLYNSESGVKERCLSFEFVNGSSTVAPHITTPLFEYGDDESQDCSAFADLSERIGCRVSNFFKSAMAFLFVPSPGATNTLRNGVSAITAKLPFSVFQEFSSAWATSTAVSTTTAPATLNLYFYGATSTIISTSTLESVGVDTSAWSGVRTVMVIGLWVAFAWFCFIRISKFF